MTTEVESFALSECAWIGFDLDHTLVRYKLDTTNRLIFENLAKFLVNAKDYPAHLAKLAPCAHFGTKGVVFDRTHGHFVVLAHDKRVVSGFHGTQRLDSDQLKAAYGGAPLHDFTGDNDARFLPMITFFDMPVAWLLTHAVDCFDKGQLPSSCKSYSDVVSDFLDGFNATFNDFWSSDYFAAFRADIDKFVWRRPDVRKWLESLRQRGHKTFLITNSQVEYAVLLLKHAFGDDWATLFDVSVIHAQKPRFFTGDTPFAGVDDQLTKSTDDVSVSDLVLGGIYCHGNARHLETFFERNGGGSVIYFGDHLRGDVFATKRYTNWLSAGILEEMESAPEQASPDTSVYQAPHLSKHWGSFFKHDEHSGQSWWAQYAVQHSHLVVPCLSVLAKLPIEERFSYDHQSDRCFFPKPHAHP